MKQFYLFLIVTLIVINISIKQSISADIFSCKPYHHYKVKDDKFCVFSELTEVLYGVCNELTSKKNIIYQCGNRCYPKNNDFRKIPINTTDCSNRKLNNYEINRNVEKAANDNTENNK